MYEIDFLPVGKKPGDKCGDAIALRFVPPNSGQWAQVVIDAGFKDDGKALVEHVNTRRFRCGSGGVRNIQPGSRE
jgi:hypothetical protein